MPYLTSWSGLVPLGLSGFHGRLRRKRHLIPPKRDNRSSIEAPCRRSRRFLCLHTNLPCQRQYLPCDCPDRSSPMRQVSVREVETSIESAVIRGLIQREERSHFGTGSVNLRFRVEPMIRHCRPKRFCGMAPWCCTVALELPPGFEKDYSRFPKQICGLTRFSGL